MRTIMIYPHKDRMIANPAYRVRVPHEPHRILAVQGERCPMTPECVRLIKCGDVETDADREERKPKKKASKKKKG